jgi:hypothetical protein
LKSWSRSRNRADSSANINDNSSIHSTRDAFETSNTIGSEAANVAAMAGSSQQREGVPGCESHARGNTYEILPTQLANIQGRSFTSFTSGSVWIHSCRVVGARVLTFRCRLFFLSISEILHSRRTASSLRPILYFQSATSHRSGIPANCFQSCEHRYTPQPPCSPDISLRDLFLFDGLKIKGDFSS